MSEVSSDLMAFLGDDITIEVPEAEETVETVEEVDDTVDEVEAEEAEDEASVEQDSDDVDDDDGEVDEDSEETDTEEPEGIELVLEGETVRITKEELTSGYMRQKDYQAKVSDAESKIEKLKSQEVELMKVQEVFAFSSTKQLAEFNQAVEAEGGWLAIERNRDPVQVSQFKALYQNVQNNAKLAEGVQAEFKAQREAAYETEMMGVAKHLIKTVPGVTKETFEELDKYVMDMGLTEDYVRNIRDPIAWTLIHKAMAYDKAQVRKVAEPNKQPVRVKKSVNTRKEQPASGRRSLDKKIGELSKSHGNKEKNSALARDALADLLRLG